MKGPGQAAALWRANLKIVIAGGGPDTPVRRDARRPNPTAATGEHPLLWRRMKGSGCCG
jgi:hypothetical protein